MLTLGLRVARSRVQARAPGSGEDKNGLALPNLKRQPRGRTSLRHRRRRFVSRPLARQAQQGGAVGHRDLRGGARSCGARCSNFGRRRSKAGLIVVGAAAGHGGDITMARRWLGRGGVPWIADVAPSSASASNSPSIERWRGAVVASDARAPLLCFPIRTAKS